MDLRKLKTLIDLVSDSNVTELEITEAEGKVRIVKGAVASGAPVLTQQVMVPAAAPVAAPAAAWSVDPKARAGVLAGSRGSARRVRGRPPAVGRGARRVRVRPRARGARLRARLLVPVTMARAGTQILTLTGLRFDANLGILEHEKTDPQPIQVDAELNLGTQPLLPSDDDINHVLDYRKVRKIIIEECTAEHVNLLETLIGKLSNRLMQLPGVLGVRVKIAKLEIFEDCEVAIRMETGQW